ncbi:MAG: ferric reductase-like transmembrane domain-containing protein [Gammaproteobacteria bacterium]
MTTGRYEKVSPTPPDVRRFENFGGWLAFMWAFGCLMAVWHFTAVIGDDRGLSSMFATPDNVAIMRVVLWLKLWLWAPFLILAPLGHRLMPAVTVVTVLTGVIGEGAAVIYLLDLGPAKVLAINVFNALIAAWFCAYLLLSKRAAAVRASSRPVDERARRHFSLLVLVAGGVTIATFGAAPETATDRVSMLTAYQFLLLLTIVLAIGPLRTLRTGRIAANLHLRRDYGIWAGITALLHLFAGTVQSMTPAYISTFVTVGGSGSAIIPRQQIFSWGAIIGLAIALLVLVLLALSNDRSIRRFGKRRWKRLHRVNYLVLALTVAHGFAFQFLEGRATWLIAFVLLTLIAVVGVQLAGIGAVLRRRRRRRRLRI